MPVFALRLDASGVRQGSQEATSALRSVENAAQNTSQAIGDAQMRLRDFSGIVSSELQDTSQRIVDVSESLNATRISANGASSGVSSFIEAAKGVAAIGAFAVVGKQVYDVTMALNAAGSQAQETANKFNVVFASINSTATTTAQSLAANYGMTYEAAQASLSSVGDLLTGLGVSQGEALKLAKQAAHEDLVCVIFTCEM